VGSKQAGKKRELKDLVTFLRGKDDAEFESDHQILPQVSSRDSVNQHEK